MEHKNWTPETVRDELPDVLVIVNGSVRRARVRGRQLKFAQVSLNEPPYISQEVAWPTVAHCLNTDTPIKF